jgi:hypothetical protein
MKGSVLDVLMIILMVFGVAIAAILGAFFIGEMETPMVEAGADQYIFNQGQMAIGVFDNMFIVIYAGLFMLAIIMAFMVPVHPIFAILALLFSMIMIVLSVPISNMYHEFATSDAMITTANEFTQTNLVMQNLPLITIAFTVILLVVMFTRFQSAGGRT